MTDQTVSVSVLIRATADRVYSILADYTEGHQRILPRPPFGEVTVEQGGIGDGTRISFEMRAFGGVRRFQALITEPLPGRLLVETDADSGVVTTFTVDPHGGGEHTQVTIATMLCVREGIAGSFEGILTRLSIRKLYRKQLRLLSSLATAA